MKKFPRGRRRIKYPRILTPEQSFIYDPSTKVSTEIQSMDNFVDENPSKLFGIHSSMRLDKSGEFRIYENIIVGDQYRILSEGYNVTLASFSTIDKLYWIREVIR